MQALAFAVPYSGPKQEFLSRSDQGADLGVSNWSLGESPSLADTHIDAIVLPFTPDLQSRLWRFADGIAGIFLQPIGSV